MPKTTRAPWLRPSEAPTTSPRRTCKCGTGRPTSQRRPRTTSKSRRRDPTLAQTQCENLVWDTVEGVKVLVSEIPNYVAERAPNGTYSVLRLSPRSVVARRLRLKDVMPTIRREHKEDVARQEADVARQVREAERQRLSEAEARAVVDEFENAHGFYVVPGETIGPDGTVYDADGPYYRFERAGYSPDDPEDFSLDDVEDAAVEKMKSLKEYVHSPVRIVEADNAREAAAGHGLLWWEQGLFKGRPADPRQRGFGW